MNTHPKGSFAPQLLPIGRWLWRRLPASLLASRPMRRLNMEIYDRYVRHTERYQTHFTWFVRNPPQLALITDLIFSSPPTGTKLRVMSVGCSVGAELYSLLWLIRRVQPDISIDARGIDIVPDAVASARRGSYWLELPSSCGGTLQIDGRNVLSTSAEAIGEIFEVCSNGVYVVKDAIRAGATWYVGNAADPDLRDAHGLQDVVLACNFLGPMEPGMAESCIRNVAALVIPGGYLVIDGVDLGVKARVLKQLGFLPITEDAQCIHEADPTKRDWPWTRWSLEPFDDSKADWPYRYVTIFQRPMVRLAQG
ncbi:MAG TPA: CheR family methyltransferase [Lysobacter sp.]